MLMDPNGPNFEVLHDYLAGDDQLDLKSYTDIVCAFLFAYFV